MRKDSLIGKIIHSETAAPINFDTLIEQLKTAEVIYLSEKHNNPDHHSFQRDVIHALIESGIRPVLAFEFFSMDQTPDILNFIDAAKVKHSVKSKQVIEKNLRYKLGWESQSDDMWSFYFDLLSIARDNQLYAAGIDLSASLKKRITRKGIKGLSGPEKEMIASTGLNDAPYKAHMMALFKTVHCGMGNERMQQRLYDTWVARNDKMAFSITTLARYYTPPIVVIIGGGHTEHGLGVIDRVKAIAPGLKQINVALTEIRIHPAALPAYLEPLILNGHPPLPPADYVWFSQRVSYEDPCEKFRSQFNKMKNKTRQ